MLACGALFLWLVGGASQSAGVFTIAAGEAPASIAHRLQERGFVRSSTAFLWRLRLSGADRQLQAGDVFLAADLAPAAVARALQNADDATTLRVRIVEGWTNAQIDAYLAQQGWLPAGDFLDCVTHRCDFSDFDFFPQQSPHREGYFFPDTYFFTPQTLSSDALARAMLQNFSQKTAELFAKSPRSVADVVTMASIIEREAVGPEAAQIADVLWRRLDNGWRLDADATTRYALNAWQRPLTRADLDSPHPFNTRAVAGLPPGAIGNPGLQSLRAAAQPQVNNAWFYLHDPSGQAHFSATLEEHNAKKGRLL